jgi:hypothetical protein
LELLYPHVNEILSLRKLEKNGNIFNKSLSALMFINAPYNNEIKPKKVSLMVGVPNNSLSWQ